MRHINLSKSNESGLSEYMVTQESNNFGDQIIEDIEHDVENAIQNFHRDGFGNIVFYVGV